MRLLLSNSVATCLALAPAGACIAQTAKTEGHCSPVIQNQSGQTQVTIVCGDKKTQQETAEQNIETLYEAVNKLRNAQNLYLMPALDDYQKNPTEENWTLVKREVSRTFQMVDATIEATINYLGTLKKDNAIVGDIPGLLRSRTGALAVLQSGRTEIGVSAAYVAQSQQKLIDVRRDRPISPEEISKWASQYRQLMDRLEGEVARLRRALQDVQAKASVQ